jgi:DNA repair protein SbcC/Rad50
MPRSPHDPPPPADNLRTYLASVLPGSRLTNATVDAAYEPLLLLQTTNVMAAFAFSNGDMRKTYNALYGSFKRYYAEQGGQWDALDLAFVFCVQPDVPNLEGFCSSVETDVYFCRKFVIPLAPPLGSSLARLPFLPLTPLDGKSLRPASAQTFLQKCGVPPVLARYIVVQHERGPERIVEDCTSGEFGEPQDLESVANALVAQVDGSTQSVRLESVTVKNFRAYRKPETFALGADMTILYGPNGFGKTSFFDAVDFAATGGIGRIGSSSESHFVKTTQHLDSGSEESLVSLSFRCNGAVRKVTRSVRDRKQSLLDGRPSDRKTILAELTGGDIPATDRVENFVNLFRATHLFSQEESELTKNFQDDCCLPAPIVSRMLAFQDYANAVSKAAKVREFLESGIADANKEIKELSDQITDEKKELDRLSQTAKAHTNVEALDAEFDTLRGKLVAAGFAVETRKPDAAIVRGWRASIEARNGDSQSRSERLSGLAKEAVNLPQMRAALVSLQKQIAQKEQTLGTTEEEQIAAELALQRAEQRLTEMNAKTAEVQTRSALLEWVRTTKPVYAEFIQKQRTLNDELNRAADSIAQHRAAEEKAANDLRAQENRAEQVTEKLKTKRVELAKIRSLNESTASWQTNRTRLASVVESERAALKSLESLRTEEREISPQLTAVAAEEARLSRQIAEVDKSQSELRILLSQLQGHVRTGTCPLCGEDHGSKDELVRRIQKHVAADAASGARSDLIALRERSKQLAERVAGNKQRQQASGTQIADLKNERTRLDDEIGQFANSAAELGIDFEASGPTPAEQLPARLNAVQLEIEELNRQIQQTGAAVAAARTVLTNTKNLSAAKAAETTDRKAELSRLKEEASRLHDDPRLTQFSLDTNDEQVAELDRLNREQLSEFKAETVKAQTEATQKKLEVSALRQDSTSLKGQLPALRTQLANLQKSVTQITARLQESKLPMDASEEMLLSLIAEESRVQAQLLALRDSTSNLELAIDAATTAAALTTLRQNVRNKEKAVATAGRKRDQYQPWLRYFTELSRLVSSQQNEAIANFTSEYGPRTSVIQRRLRSVYGFDDIEIQSHESTISVRVKRHGEELRPTDYFSQSQQQTLLLGLFLTACISQTWSGFSPVFMDDPVTHFDDLNTYAFLDLIVGLLESDLGRIQFIISTCDEKLLQLARQKFRHLGEGAKFYRFSAISEEGPVVDEITTAQERQA